MQRLASSDDSTGFWTTIDLLIDRTPADGDHDDNEDDEDSQLRRHLTRQQRNGKAARRKSSRLALAEREWSAFLVAAGKESAAGGGGGGTRDARWLQYPELFARMQRLHEELMRLAEEQMQKRIVTRQCNETERLKKLLLNGKSPLKDCPPELRGHPVFLFWKFIEKELDRISRAKADAYYRKLRKGRPKNNSLSRSSQPSTTLDSIESGLLPADENSNSQPNSSMDNGDGGRQILHRRDTAERYSPQIELKAYKYEDEDVKELEEIVTVEDLYRLADRIVGATPRHIDTTAR